MKTRSLLVSMMTALCFWSCSDNDNNVFYMQDNPEHEEKLQTEEPVVIGHSYKPVQLNESQRAINDKLQEFSWKLFKEVYANRQEGANLMISPISLEVDLGMFINGLEGETLQEVLKTMGLENFTKEQVNDYFKTIMNGIEHADEAAIFKSANSFWYSKNKTANKDFLSVIQNNYDAKAEAVDYADSKTKDIINAWCAVNTENRIKKMLEETTENALFHLMNAVYFKAHWAEVFPKELTSKQPFNYASGKTEDVDMMNQQIRAFYVDTDTYQCVFKNYIDDAFQLVLLLPKDGMEMDSAFPTVISNEFLSSIRKVVEVNLFVPKFTSEYTESKLFTYMSALNPSLKFDSNDIKIFDDEAIEGLEALQKTSFTMDEKGAEAAAITDISYITADISPEEFEKVEMRLDRPFIYAIIESNTQCPLFIGYYGN